LAQGPTAAWNLVVVQATLSIALLAGAGLLTRSLRNPEHQSFGFCGAGILRTPRQRNSRAAREAHHSFAI
jgi:hypothetical protein